jgi:hypothetical protein
MKAMAERVANDFIGHHALMPGMRQPQKAGMPARSLIHGSHAWNPKPCAPAFGLISITATFPDGLK